MSKGQKFFALGCACNGCEGFMLAKDDLGNEVIPIFRTKELAEIQAADFQKGEVLIVEIEAKRV